MVTAGFPWAARWDEFLDRVVEGNESLVDQTKHEEADGQLSVRPERKEGVLAQRDPGRVGSGHEALGAPTSVTPLEDDHESRHAERSRCAYASRERTERGGGTG